MSTPPAGPPGTVVRYGVRSMSAPLRAALAAHVTSEGVSLDARTWIITARRG